MPDIPESAPPSMPPPTNAILTLLPSIPRPDAAVDLPPSMGSPGIQQAISSHPDPVAFSAQIQAADAVSGLTDSTFPQGMQFAQALSNGTPKQQTLLQDMGDAWKSMQAQSRADFIAYQIMQDGETPELLSEYRRLISEAEGLKPAKENGFLRRMATGAASLASQQLAALVENGRLWVVTDPLEGSVFRKYEPTGREPPRPMGAMSQLEAGSAYMEARDAGVPPEIARPMGYAVGSINGIIELAGDAAFVALFPGAGAAAKKIAEGVSQRFLSDALLKSRLVQIGTKAATAYVGGVATQMAPEYVQETVTFLGQEIAREAANDKYELDLQQQQALGTRLQSLTDEMLPGMMAMGFLPAAATGVQAARQGKPAAAAEAAPEAPPPAPSAIRQQVADATPETLPAVLEEAKTQVADVVAVREQELQAAPELTPEAVTALRDAYSLEEELATQEQQLQEAAEAPAVTEPVPTERFPPATPTVGGLRVTENIPNLESISASLGSDYEELPGVRIVQMKEFTESKPYSKSERERVEDLASAIQENQYIDPLIVAIDEEGPYILEGGHRMDALSKLGVQEFPAIIVLEEGVDPANIPTQEHLRIAQESAPTVQKAVEAGTYVARDELIRNESQPWAQQELQQRADLADLGTRLWDAQQATDAESFIAEVRAIHPEALPDAYLEALWENEVTKPEPATEEGVRPDEDLVEALERAEAPDPGIDRTIAAYREAGRTATISAEPGGEQRQAAREALTSARAEARQQTGQARQEGRTEVREEVRERDLRRKLSAAIMRRPTPGLSPGAFTELEQLQSGYVTRGVRGLKRTQAQLAQWQAAHPDATVTAETQQLLARRPLADLSTAELTDLYEKAKKIRDRGRAEMKAFNEAKKQRRVAQAERFLADLGGAVERLREYSTQLTQKAKTKIEKKNAINALIEQPRRFFEAMGPSFEKWFWDDRMANESTKQVLMDEFGGAVHDSYESTGLTPRDVVGKFDGRYWLQDILYYFGQMKDENGRKAVLWGNDEDEGRLQEAFSKLTPQQKQFVDQLQDMYLDLKVRLDKAQLEAEYKVSKTVGRYLPIWREFDQGRTMGELLDSESEFRGLVPTTPQGWKNARVEFREGTEQNRIRTDLQQILVESVEKATRYIAHESWARDSAWLLNGRSKESKAVTEAIRHKLGAPTLEMLRNYVAAVARPESFNGMDHAGKVTRIMRTLMENNTDAVLAFNMGSVLMNLEGPARTLSRLNTLNPVDWGYFFAGLARSTPGALKTSLRAMYEMSPRMKDIAEQGVDQYLREGGALKKRQTGLGYLYQDWKRLRKKGGYFMMREMQKWTVSSTWWPVYYSELRRSSGNKQAAIAAADRAVDDLSPSGRLADAPQIYWQAQSNWLLKWALRFTRAANQQAQMLLYDVPRQLKKGQVGMAIGAGLSLAATAMVLGFRLRGRFPESPEELKEDMAVGLAGAASAVIPQAGEVLLGAAGYPSREFAEGSPVYSVAREGRRLVMGARDVEAAAGRMAKQALRLLGEPVIPAERLARTFYDFDMEEFRVDALELFGIRNRK